MTDKSPLPYHISNWSEGYVDVNADGDLGIKPQRNERFISLGSLYEQLKSEGLRPPILVRFRDILHDRVNLLCSSFNAACSELEYDGKYELVYPIKVNQQRRVVEEITQAQPAKENKQIGLEAGSKAELLGVLALSPEPGSTIVCNGYKDKSYIEMALRGQQLGFKVYLVVEKLSELDLILTIAKEMNLSPNIGIRARLASIGKGNWQNTGGEKSKFGLSADQIITAVEHLKQANALNTLTLLHFHLGSQIANIRDIQVGLQECACYYSQLKQLGAPIETIDVGGGLGVDYDGTRSRNYCSMNYSIRDYANLVIKALKEECDKHSLTHPNIISESGRAISAHHAVLLTDIIDLEQVTADLDSLAQITNIDPTRLPNATQHLREDLLALHEKSNQRSLVEIYYDAAHAYDEIQNLFIFGSISIEDKAIAERVYLATCKKLLDLLDANTQETREIREELTQKLADKIFINFSLFQSTPDIWGIDQIFPILPVKYLHKPMGRSAVIQDITCDSDGRIDEYVSSTGIEKTLSLPTDAVNKGSVLGFFMLGAYQEILGDMHNLFGDTDSVDVSLDENGQVHTSHAIRGDTTAKVLEYVNLSPQYLEEKFRSQLERSSLSENECEGILLAFQDALASYTYLQQS